MAQDKAAGNNDLINEYRRNMPNEQLRTELLRTIGALQYGTANTVVNFQVRTALVHGVLVKAQARQFNFTVDEPESLGGTDIAPNPVEYLLAALGACQEIVYAAYAAVQGLQLDAVRVDVKGPIDLKGLFGLEPGVAPGFREISYTTVIESPEDKAAIEELVRTVEAHCPVLDTLVNPVKVTGKVEIRTTQSALA